MIDIRAKHLRSEITGYNNFHQVSDLGVVQFRHNYDEPLLKQILNKAIEIKETHSEKRQLNLNYIRDAATHIPEINELLYCNDRLAIAEELAGVKLEPYPISVISSIITFTSVKPSDGAITWHADGVPVTELVPLLIEDPVGGELELFKGVADDGLARVHSGDSIDENEIISVEHQVGYSVLGQLMRLMHRVRPMTKGYRVTLNMNFRSAAQPYIDDNSMCYLAADNPSFEFVDQYLNDVKMRQLPAYMNNVGNGG